MCASLHLESTLFRRLGSTTIVEEGLFLHRHMHILEFDPAINARLAKPCHV